MGIIKAVGASVDGVLADAWKEFFYCDAIPHGTMVVRAKKHTSEKSANHGDDNIITQGSVIAVADGQCAIVTVNGKVMAVFDEPGEHLFEWGSGMKGMLREIGRRITFGGDAAAVHRVYYVNLLECMNHPFSQSVPVRVLAPGGEITVTCRCEGTYSFRITDPYRFYANVSGNVTTSFFYSQLGAQTQAEFAAALSPALSALSAQGMELTELPAHTQALSDAVQAAMQDSPLADRGLGVVSIALQSVTVSGSGIARQERREDLAYISGVRSVPHKEEPPVRLTKPADIVLRKPTAPDTDKTAPVPSSGEWHCRCGQKNTGRFCTECGSAAPWQCTCGQTNTGRFCIECGRSRP